LIFAAAGAFSPYCSVKHICSFSTAVALAHLPELLRLRIRKSEYSRAAAEVPNKDLRYLTKTLGLYRDCPEPKAASQGIWWAVSIEPFQVGRSRWRRMRFAMGIQSYSCCLTASRLPGNGIVERSSRSRCLHYAPAMKVLRIRKGLIVGTRSLRHTSGLLETPNCLLISSG
jgi:hypothetical protein